MRIIAGQWRSRRLMIPRTARTRPMPDRVKKAVFDILAFQYGLPGGLPPLNVADVFAGSGSMGLEALSRGAASCCFYERDPVALEALNRNLDALGAGGEATIVACDAWRAASGPQIADTELMFLDPPYRQSQDTSETGPVARFLRRLAGARGRPMIVVLHHHVRVHCTAEMAASWNIFDQRVYGSNRMTFLSS